ncbi:unnamed protein product, partial [Closterium sp. NIES-54]
RLQLRERFHQDLPDLHLHSNRGGEFSSDLLRKFCRGEGILQSFTLSDSPQKNGIAERRIGLVMEVARTSMIHAAAPHFVWPFVVWYTAHHLNLWPHVSLSETSPTPRWTGKVSDASVFRGPSPLGVSQVDLLLGTVPVEVAGDSGAARGAVSGGAEPGGTESGDAEPGGTEPGGAEPAGLEPGGAEPKGVEPGGVDFEGVESEGAEPRGDASCGVLLVLRRACLCGRRLSPRRSCVSDLFGTHAFGVELPEQEALEMLELEVLEILLELVVLEVLRLLDLEVLVPGVLELTGLEVLGALELNTLLSLDLLGLEALELEVQVLVALELEELELLALELEALAREELEVEELELLTLQLEVRDVPSSTGLPPPLLCPPFDQSQPPLQPASLLPAPSPYTEQTGGLKEHREPASRPASPVHTCRRVPRPRPPPVPGTHAMALCLSSSIVSRFLATIVTDPSFESTAASVLVAELLDFADACRLDYATALVTEYESTSPLSVRGECALGTDVLEDRQEDFE